MMEAISKKDRESIILHKQNGEKDKEIAKWLCISVRSISRIWRQYGLTGNCDPKPKNSGRKALVTEEQMTNVAIKIKEMPDITLNDLIDEFELGISEAALCKRLCKLGYTLKKRLSIQLHSKDQML